MGIFFQEMSFFNDFCLMWSGQEATAESTECTMNNTASSELVVIVPRFQSRLFALLPTF